ncbi:MAG: hypothetical protein HOP11_08455 [Saprospiraceae bacterium]|nr:hypothetical protein [Saprospiraceae bacterium]
MCRQLIVIGILSFIVYKGECNPVYHISQQEKPKKTASEKPKPKVSNNKDPKAYSKTTESPNLILSDTTKKSTKPSAKKAKTKNKKK